MDLLFISLFLEKLFTAGMGGELLCFLCRTAENVSRCSDCGVGTCPAHLPFHRDPVTAACFPFSVGWDCEMGHCLLASRDIKPGQLIFRDTSVLYNGVL